MMSEVHKTFRPNPTFQLIKLTYPVPVEWNLPFTSRNVKNKLLGKTLLNTREYAQLM